MKFIVEISGEPGSETARTTFSSGATSEDLQCAQFFMTMQDRGMSLDEVRAYAKAGPQLVPTVDWDEIGRVLATF